MHYHENDDPIFMVLEGECTVRTPHKEFVLKQHDTVMLQSKQPYQLCNTGKESCCYSELGTPERMACHEAEYQTWRVIRRCRNR